ncbi:MAG TPA: hypothetical protein VGE52_13005, partial [Pirellulales bacterium]
MKQHVVRWTAWAAVVVSGVFAAAQIQRNFMSPAAAQTPAHASDETSAAASDPFAGMPAAAKETATVGFGDAAAEEPAGTTFVPSATASPYGAVSPYGSSNGGSTLEPARSAYALPSEAGYSPLPSAADAVPPDANAAPAGSTLTPRSAYSAPSPYAALPEAGSLGAAAPAAPGWSVGEPTPAPSNYGLPPVGETVSAEPPATLPSDALPASTTALPPNAASTFAASAPLSAAPVETPAEATPSPAPVRSSPFAAAPAGTGEPSANAFDAEAEPATLPTGSGETASPLTEFAPVESAPLDAFAAPAATPSAVPVDDGLNRTALPARGQGEPGPRELEGPQQPQLTVEKLIPREVQVGAPTLIEIVVRNVGNVPAHRVEVLDSVPKNTELIDAAPHAEADAQGDLVWRLGTLQPQDEGIIRMRVRPLVEGPIGSTAFVSFAVEATCRTIATRPVLQV